MMKAIRLIKPSEPLQMQEMELPQVGRNDVLVRVRAAGICHSDAHYRAGRSLVRPLPLTLGHEVAGVVESTGAGVSNFKPGDRVCLHYLATCGSCAHCQSGNEQFCPYGQMMGKFRDGGYAEFVVMPERSVFRLPPEVSFAHGAVMMCSSATSLHALYKARLRPGETVAVFGVGGLGLSAIQLAKAFGASEIYAVDIKPEKLARAERLGATPVNTTAADVLEEIARLTDRRGVDVALELIGSPVAMQQAVRCLAVRGRAALVGITDRSFSVAPYMELLNKEAEIIGVSDHLASELPQLLEWARIGTLNLSGIITRTIPLDPGLVSETLTHLERFSIDGRVVIEPI